MTDSSDLRITRINYYRPADYYRRMIAQSWGIIEIETNQGITGIGEGGSPNLVEKLGSFLIGEDPLRIEHLWQMMFRGDFYPAGRELLHALGGLDIALWDIKGKVLDTPVYQLLGGKYREYIECYATAYDADNKNLADAARKCIDAGFLAYRTGGFKDFKTGTFDPHTAARRLYSHCEEIATAVGSEGQWAIDFHTRLDPPQAVRLANLITDLEPLFCEDLVRSENVAYYRHLRNQVSVSLAAGEQYGTRWDCHELLENNLIDFARMTQPNVGGITEMKKIQAILETHYIGLIPHFTGPISLAAQTHCSATFSGVVVQEIAGNAPKEISYLNSDYVNFRDGKLYIQDRPGIGVELKTTGLEKLAEVTERDPHAVPVLFRPDGSYTNW